MTEQQHNINWVTFLLAWVAGFCDTATYVSGDAIFSAHVTGNFIVFAAQVSSGGGSIGTWIKLLTFPVFVLAVMLGGWMIEKTFEKYSILLVEGGILLICGINAILLPMVIGGEDKVLIYAIVMGTAAAMGLQNAFGKLFAKATHGPTTMMTGNVTQAALDLGNMIRKGRSGDDVSWTDFRRQFVTIGGFLVGCVLGAVLAKWIGLGAILLPGVAIVICYLQGEAARQKAA